MERELSLPIGRSEAQSYDLKTKRYRFHYAIGLKPSSIFIKVNR